MSQQHVLADKKTNGIPGFMRQSITSRPREVILSLYSAQVRSHLEYWVQLWGRQYKRDIELCKSPTEGPKGGKLTEASPI